MVRACIFGCAGESLTAGEKRFFAETQPLGFILFRRNCASPEQVAALTADLRASVGRDDAPVLIDQEGGRVMRLCPPGWRAMPPPWRFHEIRAAGRAKEAREALKLNFTLMAMDLVQAGIDVDCMPLLDIRSEATHQAIGDRALGTTPGEVADLGRVVCETLLEAGILPVIKHMPGHGRALVDSHLDLPRVDADIQTLREADFVPFRMLADMPVGMTAHIAYDAIDPDRPGTLSPVVVKDVIRGEIGFDGLLLTDDLSMQALGGSLRDRAEAALAAGCDIALHCNGNAEEMTGVAEASPPLDGAAKARVDRALAKRVSSTEIPERAALEDRLAELLQLS